MSGLCRQLSVCKNKRHRGKDEPHTPLLLELEVDACCEGDVVIGAEQGDQGNHEAGMGLDDSLAIKPRTAPGRIRAFSQVWLRFDRRDVLVQKQGPSIVQENYATRSASPGTQWLIARLGLSRIPRSLYRSHARSRSSGENPEALTRPQA